MQKPRFERAPDGDAPVGAHGGFHHFGGDERGKDRRPFGGVEGQGRLRTHQTAQEGGHGLTALAVIVICQAAIL